MIKAEGKWSTPFFESSPMWNLNYSDILTTLIQYAGRYTERYASDLFIIWKYCVEEKLSDPNLESYTITFGFREGGVDRECSNDPEITTVTKNLENSRYYYRKVVKLEIKIDGNNIEMILN